MNRSASAESKAARPQGKFLRRQEARLAGRLHRRWKGQMAWLLDEMATSGLFPDEAKGVRLLERKRYEREIGDLADRMTGHREIAEDVVVTARESYRKGSKTAAKKLNVGRFELDFTLTNDDAVEYLDRLRDINLSDYRGSISHTTRQRVIRILTEAADKGETYDQAARRIREQGKAGVFSLARGRLIATNQVGHAFEEGNRKLVQRFQEKTGLKTRKRWLTVQDDRVTPECNANEDEGWMEYDQRFSSGDVRAPRQTNPRCRCTTEYEVVD